jgi:16S rRNA (guanine527-N7)-methyltransferase
VSAAPPLGAVSAAARAVLEEARARGFLGPGPVDAHVAHAWPLVGELPTTGELVDLGSGGGVPGLLLAAALPGTRWALIESRQRRAAWLRDAASTLGLGARVTVLAQRAEVVGRSDLRGRAAAVVARAFGPPAVTAECAAPLLAPGGRCWVAEPPGGAPERWPAAGLAMLGLVQGRRVGGWVGLDLATPCPDRYPRKAGIPAKRPLF